MSYYTCSIRITYYDIRFVWKSTETIITSLLIVWMDFEKTWWTKVLKKYILDNKNLCLKYDTKKIIRLVCNNLLDFLFYLTQNIRKIFENGLITNKAFAKNLLVRNILYLHISITCIFNMLENNFLIKWINLRDKIYCNDQLEPLLKEIIIQQLLSFWLQFQLSG